LEPTDNRSGSFCGIFTIPLSSTPDKAVTGRIPGHIPALLAQTLLNGRKSVSQPAPFVFVAQPDPLM